MKSRRAEQVLQAASFTNEYDYQYVCIDSAYAAVELAEQDAEEKIEALKARAVCAFDSLDFTEFMTAECVQDFDNVKCRLRGLFFQKINEQ